METVSKSSSCRFDQILCGENPKRSEMGKGWPRTDLWLTWKVSDDSEIFGFNAPWCEKKEELGVRCTIQNTIIQPRCEKVEKEGVRCTMPWLSDSCWAAGAREAQQRGQHGTITLCCLKVLVENKPEKWKLKYTLEIFHQINKHSKEAQQRGQHSGDRYPIWFNSIFEFCQKMIHSILDSILLCPRFNSKYYSIQKKFCWFNSKDNSIH